MLLVSNDQGDVTDGLAKAKEAWQALQAAEEQANKFAAVRSLLEAVPSTDQTWPREALLSLAQWDFKFVPPLQLGTQSRHCFMVMDTASSMRIATTWSRTTAGMPRDAISQGRGDCTFQSPGN